MKQVLSAERETRSRAVARVKKPEFFLVGAPKCGTTALSEYLGQHPDIFMAPKEMHFFGSDLHFRSHVYRRTLNGYMAEYEARNGHRLAGEASVWYLYSMQAAEEIKAFNPDARIIIMLREPTEMLYSLYHEFRFNGNECLPTFEAALAAQEERRAGRCIGRRALLAAGLLYQETARYAQQVRRYFNAFGREKVHVIVHDDLVQNPEAVARQAVDFLGVDPHAAPANFPVVNANKYPKSQVLQWILTEPLLQTVAGAFWPWLPPSIRIMLRQIRARLTSFNTCVQQRSPMSSSLRLSLKRQFVPEVEELSELLQRDLTHWSK